MKEDKLWLANLGNGQYKNPVLHADYSDPDVAFYKGYYYLTASSFQYTPGLPILKSNNLVDWELVNYALPTLGEGFELPRMSEGVWAPSIRVYQDSLWIFYGMPDEGIYAISTTDPEGAWSSPQLIKEAKGFIDPCPYWDEEGNGYIVHGYAKSRIGFKSVLGIFQFMERGVYINGDDTMLFNGHPDHFTIEGPKVYKKNDYYYIFAPAGGVEYGWQTVLRSENLHGPYEIRIVLQQGSSEVNGPHQGAWVETEDGKDYFLHFQKKGAYGRISHLQPMEWEDGWPIIGKCVSGENYGEPVEGGVLPQASLPISLQASDDFSGETLSLIWQWLGNPIEGAYALEEGLRLYALNQDQATEFSLWQKSNVLTQKIIAPSYRIEVQVDTGALEGESTAGLAMIGATYMRLGVEKNKLVLAHAEYNGLEEVKDWVPYDGQALVMGMELLPIENTLRAKFFYRLESSERYFIGEPLELLGNMWTGAKPSLYAIGKGEDFAGYARFRNYHVEAMDA